MIEDVPVASDLHDAAVVVCAESRRLIRRLICIDADIAVADDDSAVLVRSQRIVRITVAELVHYL